MASQEEEDDCEADLIAAQFMEKSLNIEDPSFLEECNNEIKKTLRHEFKRKNDKIASTYRKNLTDCKFPWLWWHILVFTFLYNKCKMVALHPIDYAREMDKGSEVLVPTKATLIKCLLTGSPEDCNENEAREVAFFYKVALATVESKMLKSKALMDQNDSDSHND
jgi:hypothetical protein